jgi:hypothetical protein
MRRLFDVAGFEVASDSEITNDHRFSVTPIGVLHLPTQHIPGIGKLNFLLDWLEMRGNGLGNTRAWPERARWLVRPASPPTPSAARL